MSAALVGSRQRPRLKLDDAARALLDGRASLAIDSVSQSLLL